ncbi:MAG: NAD(P)/FAD-dependent oxidoreductase [Rickettsiales endosymbiont of Dermacentor nuttalli]
MAKSLHNFQVIVTGSEGYHKAEVTSGGVDTEKLSSKTMKCKKIPNLYFIGEIVDVISWLGGYNFNGHSHPDLQLEILVNIN